MILSGNSHFRSNFRRLIVSSSLLTGLLLLNFEVGLAQGAHLFHSPATSAESGKAIPLTATLEGSSQLPTDGRIYYRLEGNEAFAYAEMKIERYQLSGEIPARVVTKGELVYYISTELEGGVTLTFPMGSPNNGELFRVVINSAESAVGGKDGDFVILNPSPGTTLAGEELVIAVSILGSAGKIDASTINIFYDGKDFTRSATITEDLIVLAIPSVRPGAHSISITINRNGKKENLLSWGFKGPVEKRSRIAAGPVSANVTTGVGYENVSNQTRKMGFLDARINGNLGKLNWAGKAYVTSYESKYLQPQNRFIGMLEYGSAALKVGDAQPRFSEFSLWGVRTRGVEFGYHGFAFNLDVAQGEVVRGIEGTSKSDTTFVIDDATGDTLRSVTTGLDSIIVVNITDRSGRFKRNVLAIRPGFPLSDNTTLSFNIVKAKDDVKSIEWGRSPKDNLVLGFDLNVVAVNRRVIFNTETALSLYNSDISSGPMDKAKSLESLIIVNQFFEPLPTDSSILADSVEMSDLAKKMLSELAKSSLAHRTNLTLNFFHNELRLGYKTIGRSFRSLGSPTIMTDVGGISIEDRIRLVNSRLYLTLGYETYTDNINGRNSTTTEREILRANIAIYSPPKFPNLNLGIRTYDRSNDGISKSDTLPDGRIFVTDSRIKNRQNQYNLSIDESFGWLGYDNLVAVSYSSAITDDQINPALATDLTSINLNLQARRQPFEWNSSVGITTQSAQNGALSVDYTSLSFGGKYTIIKNKLWITASVSSNSGEGGNDNLTPFVTPSDSIKTKVYRISYQRMGINAGAEYQYNLSHSLSLSVYTATHSDEGFNETWGGVKSFSKDSPNFISQDDKSARLTYNYKI